MMYPSTAKKILTRSVNMTEIEEKDRSELMQALKLQRFGDKKISGASPRTTRLQGRLNLESLSACLVSDVALRNQLLITMTTISSCK